MDEINFLRCAPPEKRKCANKQEFACLSGECINNTLVCDFSLDCPDGSDESNCSDYLERCDFENGWCGWSQDPNSDQKWKLTSGKELAEGTGPDRDHTINDETGHFLMTSRGSSYYYWYNSKITSTSFMADTSGNCKLRFWYHLYSSYTSRITVYLQLADDTRLRSITNFYGSPGDEWERAEVPLKSKFNFHVVIEGAPSSGLKGEVAIDDTSFSLECIPVYTIITTPIPTIQPKGVCERKGEFRCDDNSCVPMEVVCDFKIDCPYGRDEKSCPAFCDFELGSTCGWKAITTIGDGVEVNVTIAEDAVKISSEAPKVDKTTNTSQGSYLIIHTSLETETGPIDEYRSPLFATSAAPCTFSLWYAARVIFMRPTITLLSGENSDEMVALGHSSTWKRETFGIGRQKSNFTISIIKKGGMSRMDYLAVDDIEFLNCALPGKSSDICYGFRCKQTKACIDYSRVCDLTDDCGDATDEQDCATQNFLTTDFENGFGLFTQLTNKYAPLFWEIKSGATAGHIFSRIGPPFDHTLSNSEGHYISMSRGSLGSLNERAWIVSDVLRSLAKGECEMRFYYFMYGNQINQLNIYTTTRGGAEFNDFKLLWTQTGEVGNFWMRGSVALNDTIPFQVILEGKAGIGTKDVISLDDVSFSAGCRRLGGETLPPKDGSTTTPIPTDCKSNEFFCVEDKVCIPKEKKCDFRFDCKDKSDEAGCVREYCNFENKDLCGWQVFHKLNNITRVKRQALERVDDSAFRWIPIQANDTHTMISLSNRPKTDHTQNSTYGWYLLADGGPGRTGDVSSLTSPDISATHAQCALDFWVYCGMWSCDLNVYAGQNGLPLKQVWNSYSGLYGKRYSQTWVHAKAYLSALKNFKVQFDVVRPITYSSAVSLDDIMFENCVPPVVVNPLNDTCDGGLFMCGNGKCIADNLLCDYNDDCTDYSDERDFQCQTYVARCNFDNTPCREWILEQDQKNSWAVMSASGYSMYSSFPQFDHTSRTSEGKYLSASQGYDTKNTKPRVRSPTIDGYSKECKVRFWYNSVSEEHAIRIYKRTSYNEGGYKFLQEFTSDVTSFWHRAELEIINKGEDFQIVLEAILKSTSGSINIDDISLTPTCHVAIGRDIPGNPTTPPPIDDCYPKLPCKNKKCYTHLQRCNFIDDCGDGSDEEDCGTSCDFEKGMCGWYNTFGYRGNWTIKSGKSGWYSSLDKDHTTGTEKGHYLTPDGLIQQGDVAQIHTKNYVISGSNCNISLWYYKDQTIGAPLRIMLERNKRVDKFEEIWKTEEDEGTEWVNVEARIKAQEHFSIVIEARLGKSYLYSFAIDDIEFIKCSAEHPPVECVKDEFMCEDKQKCIKVWAHCDGKYDCDDKSDENMCQSQHGDCDFDSDNWKDVCEWRSKDLMQFEWSRAKEARNNDTGPPRNQNPRQEGYFLYIDSSKQAEGERAGVQTPVFKPSEGKCHLRFWYYMKGSPSMGTLEVISEGENGQMFPVFRKGGPQGAEWMYAHSLLGNDQPYRVTFVATRGGDDKTDIAIDEVRFTHGCEEGGEPIVPTGDPVLCMKDEFRCKSVTQCIPKAWKCDCAYDCEDGSDEKGCDNECVVTKPPKEITTRGTTKKPNTVIPQKHCPSGQKLCDDGKTCIFGLLLCDGVNDCPDGSDERHGCHNARLCTEKFYFCQDRVVPPCVAREKICDGVNDCSDGSDESICDKCPPDFCRNEGNCSIVNHAPVCKCKPEFAQNRCATLKITPDLEEKLNYEPAGVSWIVGVVVGTILLIAIMFVIWFKRNTNAERARLPHAVDNPVYGLNLDTLTFGELNTHMPVRHKDEAGATAIENPLYAFKSEIK